MVDIFDDEGQVMKVPVIGITFRKIKHRLRFARFAPNFAAHSQDSSCGNGARAAHVMPWHTTILM